MKHANIPVFIPHLGCPNDCVFCNQRSISGIRSFDITNVDGIIRNALSTIDRADTETEIAFFGGSFTGIDRNDMIYLLEVADKYIKSGDVSSIRLSTRPDYIDDEILSILKQHSVKTIELGLQSMDEKVLIASKRGHTAERAVTSCKMIKEAGFVLIGQMMIGLPCSTLEKELYTANIIAELCDGARVYPTVVFEDTELNNMSQNGSYTPLELDDCIIRTGEVINVFAEKEKPVIRIGLQSSDNLFDGDVVKGGSYHPAIGELAENYVYLKKMIGLLEEYKGTLAGKNIIFSVAKGSTSKAVGQRKANKINIINKFNVKSLKIVEKNDILGYNIFLSVE